MYKYDWKGPKRGVALYSYSAEFGLTKSLEECFEDVHDMGAHGIEILANTHIENYPYPTDEWVEKWFRLCDKYEIIPVEATGLIPMSLAAVTLLQKNLMKCLQGIFALHTDLVLQL